MATFKVVYEYNGPDGASWTETFYGEGGSPNDFYVQSTQLYTARLNLLHPTCFLARIRISNTDGTRNTVNRIVNWQGTGPVAGGPLMSEAAGVLQLVGATGGARKLWMRGLPQAYVIINSVSGRDDPPAAYRSQLKDYFQGLKNQGLGIRVKQRTVKFMITEINAVPNSPRALVNFLIPPGELPPAWTPATSLQIAQTDPKTLPGLNGTWKPIGIGTNVITIPYRVPGAQLTIPSGGYIQQLTYSAVRIFDPAACAFDHYGSHDTKTPLFHSRGRRRAARLRTSV